MTDEVHAGAKRKPKNAQDWSGGSLAPMRCTIAKVSGSSRNIRKDLGPIDLFRVLVGISKVAKSKALPVVGHFRAGPAKVPEAPREKTLAALWPKRYRWWENLS